MNKAAAVTFCAGILAASISANSARSQSVCPRGSAGFIQAGGQTICIGTSSDLPQNPQQRQPAATTTASTTNPDVDVNLNDADQSFRNGDTKLGCQWVGNAISAARQGVSSQQSSQLKSYAKRCNLRY
jgi:hypothetical protein